MQARFLRKGVSQGASKVPAERCEQGVSQGASQGRKT